MATLAVVLVGIAVDEVGVTTLGVTVPLGTTAGFESLRRQAAQQHIFRQDGHFQLAIVDHDDRGCVSVLIKELESWLVSFLSTKMEKKYLDLVAISVGDSL